MRRRRGLAASACFAVAMRCGGLVIFGVAYGTVLLLALLSYRLATHANPTVHSFGWPPAPRPPSRCWR